MLPHLRLVAAIGSVQLYVHRCLINLEQSDLALNPTVETSRSIPPGSRVTSGMAQELPRVGGQPKGLSLPELYIDPSLRDNKTHLFRELEEELLQEKITKDSAEAAYKKYLAQFAELTQVRYAGAYYHSDYEPAVVDLSGQEGASKAKAFLMINAYFPGRRPKRAATISLPARVSIRTSTTFALTTTTRRLGATGKRWKLPLRPPKSRP